MTNTEASSARLSASERAAAAAPSAPPAGSAGFTQSPSTVDRGGDDDRDGDEHRAHHGGERLVALLDQLLPQVVGRELVDDPERDAQDQHAEHRIHQRSDQCRQFEVFHVAGLLGGYLWREDSDEVRPFCTPSSESNSDTPWYWP